MRVNAEKILKIQAKEFMKDADFAYDDNTSNLDNDSAHMIAQKTLLRVNALDSFINNIVNETEIQKSTALLSKKMLRQTQEDVDYMYPHGNIDENNSHVVMQLIKRTGEDLSNFLDCFQQKHEVESKINMVDLLKEQFVEYNNDLDYAYPNNNYNDDNAHIVLQGLLGKSEFLYQVLENSTPVNEEESEFKTLYLDKISGLIELLNSGYNQEGYYQNNGHDVFSQIIEGLKVEIKDLSTMKLRDNEELDNTSHISVSSNTEDSRVSHTHQEMTSSKVQTNEESKTVDFTEEEVKPRNEAVKTRLKNMM